MKALRIAGLVFAALLVLAAGVFAWAIYSESGARSALAISKRWLPAGITIGELSGTVAGTLHIRNFRYHDRAIGMDLVVDDAVVESAALALLRRRLHVQRARISGVRLELFAGTPSGLEATPASPRSASDPWQAPIDMQVDDLELLRGELRRTDAPPFVIDSLQLAASWTGKDVVASRLELQGPQGQVSLSTHIGPPAPRLQQLQSKFRWRFGEREWAGTLEAHGGRESLELAAAFEAPVSMKVAATLAGLRASADRSTWRAHLSVPRFDPHPLVDSDAFKTLALELDAEGDLQVLALNGTLSVDENRVLVEQLKLARTEQMLDIPALRVRLNSQPAALTGKAQVSLDGSRASSAQLAWDEFRLPDAWAGANFRSSGNVALTLSQDRYAANAKARLARAGRYSALTLRVDGSRERLHIAELELTQQPGALSVTGDIDLAKPMRWTLDARARAFDPSLFFDAWPGALDFELATQGRWPEAGPQADFRLTRLAGRLRGRAVSGEGDARLGPDLRPSGRMQLHSGGASLEVVALPGAQPRVDAALKIAALREWRGDLDGSLHVEATALGRWPDVDVNARVAASKVRHRAATFDSASLRLHAQAVRTRAGREPRGTADIEAKGLEIAGFRFEDLTAKLDGDAHAHQLALDARGKPVSVSMRSAGSLERNGWSGTLDSLALDVEHVPSLRLAEPARIASTRDSFELANACLKGGDIALCAAARSDARSFSANYSVRALPLGVLVALAAPDAAVTVDGTFEGNGELHRMPDGALAGRAALTSATGSIAQRGDQQALVLEYRDFGVDLDLGRDAARATLRGTLPRQGDLEGAVTLAVGQPDPALAGRAALKLRDLAPLGIWVPQLANLRGSGELAAEVGGTLHSPHLGLTVRATGLDAEVPALGVHLREGNASAALTPGGGFQADGSIASGGTLRLKGTRNSEGALELRFDGTNFLAANIPGARVVVGPELALSGVSGKLALTGSVKIEEADVDLEKLSIAHSYQTSSDVVVVDRAQQEKSAGLGLSTDVRVVLGERVKLAGFGLDTTVAGELRVVEEKEQPGRATGEIRLLGTYEAFGRKLSIERGRLQFAATTLDDPQLDILASRKLQDITAKLRVTGTAQHPTLEVFTDPATSQTDAMSYLLTGKAASEAHGEEGQMVSTAAQSVGSMLGNRLVKKLGGGKKGFVDEIGVEQNADLGGNAFTVGKYLSPRFFVSYGVGLFEPGSTMTVRYEFSKHWSLEAHQTPDDGHAGIRYRIEK